MGRSTNIPKVKKKNRLGIRCKQALFSYRRLQQDFLYLFFQILVALVVSFMLCWTPYAVMSMVSMFHVFPVQLTVLPCMFAKLAPCLNPLLHTFLNTNMHNQIRNIWCCTNKTRKPDVITLRGKYHTANKGMQLGVEQAFARRWIPNTDQSVVV